MTVSAVLLMFAMAGISVWSITNMVSQGYLPRPDTMEAWVTVFVRFGALAFGWMLVFTAITGAVASTC